LKLSVFVLFSIGAFFPLKGSIMTASGFFLTTEEIFALCFSGSSSPESKLSKLAELDDFVLIFGFWD